MALPAIAALIARMTAGRAGAVVLSELLGSRAGAAAATRGAAAAAGEAEGAAAAEAVKKGVEYKTAEELLRRPRPQAPQGGVSFQGNYYKPGSYIPRAAVEMAYLRSGGRSADVVRATPENSLGGPPPIQPSMLSGGGGGGLPPSVAGNEATAAMDKLGNGISKVLLVMAPMAALGVVVAKLPNAVERFGRGLLDTEAPLRRFSGTINTAFAELERGDILRQKSRAEATAGSTATLVGALNQLAEDTKELRQASATVLNMIATGVVYLGRAVNWLIEKNPIIQYILKVFQAIEAFLGAINPVGNGWIPHINDLAGGRYVGKTGKAGQNSKSGGP